MRLRWRLLALAAMALGAAACVRHVENLGMDPSPEDYVAATGVEASVLPAGQLDLDGRRPTCGPRPTVLDAGLTDYAATHSRFIIVNPKLMAKVATPVKLWIYSHECGHHYYGPDEAKADCYGVQRGRREGWLTADGLDQICEFIRPGRADSTHFSGPQRCEMMRQCFKNASNAIAATRS